MGFINTSLYTGNIDFQNIPNGQESYWILPMTAMTVQGNKVPIPSGSASFSAIDTGTTLVGGPSDAITAMFARIPGSAPGTGDYEGYFTYPCKTSVNVVLTFGGQSWPIDPADFKMAQIGPELCVGSFFSLNSGSNSPSWIIGDTFLVRLNFFVPMTVVRGLPPGPRLEKCVFCVPLQSTISGLCCFVQFSESPEWCQRACTQRNHWLSCSNGFCHSITTSREWCCFPKVNGLGNDGDNDGMDWSDGAVNNIARTRKDDRLHCSIYIIAQLVLVWSSY